MTDHFTPVELTTLDDRPTVSYDVVVKSITESVVALDGAVRAAVVAGEFDDLPVAFDLMADLDALGKRIALAREQVEQRVVETHIRTFRWGKTKQEIPGLGLVAEKVRKTVSRHDSVAAVRLAAPFVLVDTDAGTVEDIPVETVRRLLTRFLGFVSSPKFKKTEFGRFDCEPDAIAEVISEIPNGWSIKVTRKSVSGDA